MQGKRTGVRLCRKLCRFSLLNFHIPHISSLGRPFSLHCWLEFACLSLIYPLFLPSVVGLLPCLVHQVLYITLVSSLISRSRPVSSLLDFFIIFFLLVSERMENVAGLGFPLEKATSAPPEAEMMFYRGCDEDEDDDYGYNYDWGCNHVCHAADEDEYGDVCGEKTVVIMDGDDDNNNGNGNGNHIGNDKQQCDKRGRLRSRSRRRLVGSLLRRAFHRIRPRPSLSSLPLRWESGVERRDYGVMDEWERVSDVERRDYGVTGKSEREWEGGGASFKRPQVCMLPLSPPFWSSHLTPLHRWGRVLGWSFLCSGLLPPSGLAVLTCQGMHVAPLFPFGFLTLLF